MKTGWRNAAVAATGFVAPLAVALVLVPLRTSVTSTNLALLLVVVVVAVSAFGNRLAGAVAALSAAAWFTYFLTEPYQSFRVHDRADVETAALLLAVGLIVSQLASRTWLLRRVAVTDATHLERLHSVTRLSRFSTSSDEVVQRVREELVDVLELRDCRFEDGPPSERLPRLEPDGTLNVPGWIWDWDKQGWPQGELELPAVIHGRHQGRFVLTPEPGSLPPSVEARLVAADLTAQAAAALDGDRRVTSTPV